MIRYSHRVGGNGRTGAQFVFPVIFTTSIGMLDYVLQSAFL